ncbi:hypothetical protein SAMN04487768_1009 [Burkholderia sp. b13]|nr:hypothetical protein SAMN04487768_1009 [Burkholderia sp. b13]
MEIVPACAARRKRRCQVPGGRQRGRPLRGRAYFATFAPARLPNFWRNFSTRPVVSMNLFCSPV